MSTVDVRVRLEPGSNLVLVELETPAAQDWVHEHVQDPMTFGQQLVVEGRYLADLIKGMKSDGLILAGG
jgi:hypothetical protein